MTPRIHLPQGGSNMSQMLLSEESLIVILQVCLLGEAIMVPQIPLPREGPITTLLTQPSIGALLKLQMHSISGRPVMTPLIWNCPEPKVVKLQKHFLARLCPRGAWDSLTHHSPGTASMSVTLTFLLHGNGKQKPIVELRSSLILKVEKKPLIQIFPLHGKKKIQGTRTPIQICHHHGIDRDARALTLTSLHPGEDRGPNLPILISLHLEGVPVPGRRLHTCILERKLGWSLMFSESTRNSRNMTKTRQPLELSLNLLKLCFETSLVVREI